MTRALQGMRVRARSLLTLAAVAALVTAGAVTVLAFADAAGTSQGLVLPLLLLGLVALPTSGQELAAARREEIGVARLRGTDGWRLTRFLLAEPLVALGVGALVGLGLGAVVARVSTLTWLGRPEVGLGSTALLVALGVTLGGSVVVLVAMSGARRTPLSEQVAAHTRPRASSTWALFWGVLVVVAAAVAVYRAGLGQDPDAVVLLGPALLGLAAGQVLWWLVRGLGRVAVARTSGSALPAFLSVRRLGRSDAVSALRLLVAAGVVAILAASGATRVASWSQDTARLSTGASVQLVLDDAEGDEALRITREADPEGRWLMAAVAVPDPAAERRRVFVDTTRYARVSGDFLDDTGAVGVAPEVGDLAVPPRETVAGSTLEIGFVEAGDYQELLLEVRVVAVTADGERISKQATRFPDAFRPPSAPSRPLDLTLALGGCRSGCSLSTIDVRAQRSVGTSQPFAPAAGTVLTLDTLSLGGSDLLDQDWMPSPLQADQALRGGVEATDAGLVLTSGDPGQITLSPATEARLLPVLVTEGLTPQARFGVGADAAPSVLTPGSDTRFVEIRAEVGVLPLIGTAGALGDLATFLDGSASSIPAAEVMVLARDDTPDAVLARVEGAGGVARTWRQVRASEEQANGAIQSRVYALMAGFCLAVAALVLLGTVARQRAPYRRDVAALRVAGLAPRVIEAAARREVLLLTGIVVVGGVLAGVLGSALLLSDLPLVEVPEFGIPLGPVTATGPTVLVALALAVIVLVTGLWSRHVQPESTRPAALREMDGR